VNADIAAAALEAVEVVEVVEVVEAVEAVAEERVKTDVVSGEAGVSRLACGLLVPVSGLLLPLFAFAGKVVVNVDEEVAGVRAAEEPERRSSANKFC